MNDAGRAARARAEREALADELARGVGLGGRERVAGAAAERARVNVQRRLKDALERISAADATMGRHLTRSVKTGMFCSYEP
jgi:non-specific serine/threonine protein kinase